VICISEPVAELGEPRLGAKSGFQHGPSFIRPAAGEEDHGVPERDLSIPWCQLMSHRGALERPNEVVSLSGIQRGFERFVGASDLQQPRELLERLWRIIDAQVETTSPRPRVL